jgi:hypothetical protein
LRKLAYTVLKSNGQKFSAIGNKGWTQTYTIVDSSSISNIMLSGIETGRVSSIHASLEISERRKGSKNLDQQEFSFYL